MHLPIFFPILLLSTDLEVLLIFFIFSLFSLLYKLVNFCYFIFRFTDSFVCSSILLLNLSTEFFVCFFLLNFLILKFSFKNISLPRLLYFFTKTFWFFICVVCICICLLKHVYNGCFRICQITLTSLSSKHCYYLLIVFCFYSS